MSSFINSSIQISQNQSSGGATTHNALRKALASGPEKGHQSSFKDFLSEQASGFLAESKDVEKKVTQFSEGKLDIEGVASEVAAMTIKVDAAKRAAEEIKTGIHSLLNIQM